MGNWIEVTGKAFERLLRWLYPGVLFLILLYLFRKPCFEELIHIKGYPWPLIIGGLGIGAVLYLIQINVVNIIFSAGAQILHWLALRNQHELRQERPIPRGWLNRCVWWWDEQADNIESPQIDEKRSDYMAYANSTFHATCITWWLTSIFYLIRDSKSPLSNMEWWIILIFCIFLFGASLNLFAKLSRVRY
jgi:hypothetical protein